MAEKILITKDIWVSVCLKDIFKQDNIVGWILVEAAMEAAKEAKAKTGDVKAFDKLFVVERADCENPENAPLVFNVEFRINGHDAPFANIMNKLIKELDKRDNDGDDE